MLLIRRRGSSLGGMGRYYRGSGMFDTIARKLFSIGIKKIINSGTSSTIAHKVADAVVNGATSTVADAIAKEVTSASVGAVKTAIDSIVKRVKRPSIIVQPPLSKRTKIDIDSLIDGSGIVYD